jgi:hypothetical protein
MITVINMIPQSLSGETNQDSEPNLAVNPANPLQIAGSAFTPNPAGSGNAPIFVSTDGGTTWVLNTTVLSAVSTHDITLKFAGTSSRLFTTILDASGPFEVHRATTFPPTAMTLLESRSNEDQPYVQSTTVMGGADVGKDRVYIGVNDFNATGGKTATVEQTLDGGTGTPTFSSIRVEKRTTLGQNGPQVRPAVHGDGTVYAAFYRWISSTGNFGLNTLVISNADLIVVRDDNWGTGATPFTALIDTSDGLAGRRVATGLSFPFNQMGVAANGQERWGGDISIAVDPRASNTVYVAYATLVSTVYTLIVVRSTDRGATWSTTPLLSIANAKNPAVAVNSLGKIGLVYQQITGSGTTQRWETHFRTSINGTTWTDAVLCTALSQSPTRTFSPYIGDYLHMMAVGKDFYGIFSANNTPDLTNFPQGVTYQRNHDFPTKKLFALDGVTLVNPSIDPFFFKATEIDTATGSDFYVRDWTNSATTHDTGLEPSTNPVFYATSDVWNQRSSSTPNAFVNDQPQNEDPQSPATGAATNFAFARISRNNPGLADTVNVEFLVAEYGTGSPYVSKATTTVNFTAAQTSKIASASWTLAPSSSTHLCLGVQISTTSDPFVTPGLSGNTPGWPTTDLLVINDNNKAQRNMSVHYGLSGGGSTHYAIIRNASKKARDFALKLDADTDLLKGFSSPTVEMQGGGGPKPFKPGTVLTAPGMKPGEYRWVAFGMASFKAAKDVSLPVDMFELVDEKVVNGFRFTMVSSTADQALREALLLNGAVFGRLQLQTKSADAADIVKASVALLRTKTISSAAYIKLLASVGDAIANSVKRFLAGKGNDKELRIDESLTALGDAVTTKTIGKVFASHVTLLNKLDIALTLVRLTKS